jgi:hypothetical protein
MSKREVNRVQLLRSNLKVLCRDHGVQLVIDAFAQADGGMLLHLECSCRRPL